MVELNFEAARHLEECHETVPMILYFVGKLDPSFPRDQQSNVFPPLQQLNACGSLRAVFRLVELNFEAARHLKERHETVAMILNFVGKLDRSFSKLAHGLLDVVAIE